MRLLLDTSAFLWFVEGSGRLSDTARNHIEDSSHELLLSIATLWEMAIKISLGKLDVSPPLPEFVQKHLALSAIGLLNIGAEHTYALARLPFHHRDPFDRMLAVQCLNDGLTLISPDTAFEAYGVQRVW